MTVPKFKRMFVYIMSLAHETLHKDIEVYDGPGTLSKVVNLVASICNQLCTYALSSFQSLIRKWSFHNYKISYSGENRRCRNKKQFKIIQHISLTPLRIKVVR